MAEYTTSVEIDAPPDTVFDFLVTAEGLTSWMGRHAELDPRAGGGFAVDIAGYPIRGSYLAVDRPRRVVVSWGMAGSDELPPGASTVEFSLTPTDRGTRVDLTHSGLPEPEWEGHADGWTHFLPRLRLVACGSDPGPDTWVPIDDRTTP
jgi:uncharacterized protein YndB with AHSA1/START domain